MGLIITLIVIGIVLLAAELLLIPGFGVAGIAGLASLIYACYHTFSTMGALAGSIVLAIIIVATAISTWIILRSKTWKKIALSHNINSKSDSTPAEKGLTVGLTGITLSRVFPMGKARFGHVDVEVSSQLGIIQAGEKVEISAIEGNKIIVKQINI